MQIKTAVVTLILVLQFLFVSATNDRRDKFNSLNYFLKSLTNRITNSLKAASSSNKNLGFIGST